MVEKSYCTRCGEDLSYSPKGYIHGCGFSRKKSLDPFPHEHLELRGDAYDSFMVEALPTPIIDPVPIIVLSPLDVGDRDRSDWVTFYAVNGECLGQVPVGAKLMREDARKIAETWIEEHYPQAKITWG